MNYVHKDSNVYRDIHSEPIDYYQQVLQKILYYRHSEIVIQTHNSM